MAETHPIDRATTAHRPWILYGGLSVAVLGVVGWLVGIVVLPLAQQPSDVLPSWLAICRAFGIPVPQGAAPNQRKAPAEASSLVAWTPPVTRELQDADRQAGAFVAINCEACHGPQGRTGSALAPKLAGLQAEVIWKELHDYRDGKRLFAPMNAIARALDEDSIRQAAAYFGTVGEPPPAKAGSGGDNAPRLVLYGDTHRGIAPCQACHDANNTDRRVMMAPVLEGQRADYLARQLGLFQTEWRHNDVFRPMREIAMRLTGDEIEQLAAWFGSRPPAGTPAPSPSNGTVAASLAGR